MLPVFFPQEDRWLSSESNTEITLHLFDRWLLLEEFSSSIKSDPLSSILRIFKDDFSKTVGGFFLSPWGIALSVYYFSFEAGTYFFKYFLFKFLLIVILLTVFCGFLMFVWRIVLLVEIDFSEGLTFPSYSILFIFRVDFFLNNWGLWENSLSFDGSLLRIMISSYYFETSSSRSILLGVGGLISPIIL